MMERKKSERRLAVSWPEPPAARSAAIELANREERKSREAGGPMPPRVVTTMGRKARPRPMQPVKCFAFFSRALSSMVAAASLAAVCRWLGRRGQRRETSMVMTAVAVEPAKTVRFANESTASIFLPAAVEDPRPFSR